MYNTRHKIKYASNCHLFKEFKETYFKFILKNCLFLRNHFDLNICMFLLSHSHGAHQSFYEILFFCIFMQRKGSSFYFIVYFQCVPTSHVATLVLNMHMSLCILSLLTSPPPVHLISYIYLPIAVNRSHIQYIDILSIYLYMYVMCVYFYLF